MDKPPLWLLRIRCEHDYLHVGNLSKIIPISGMAVINVVGRKLQCKKCARIRDEIFAPEPVHPWLTAST